MSDIYQSVLNKYKGSPSAVILFIGAFIMLLIGLNHFIEDTNSSKLGLESLERTYNLNVQIFQWSYWTMSLAPQIASVVFAYMWLSDTSKKGYGFLALGFQIMDFFADSWYRGNGNLFSNMNVFFISGLLTLVYFSIGSEFFVTIGGGLLLKLSAPALATIKITANGIYNALFGEYKEPSKQENPNHQKGNNGSQGGQGKHNQSAPKGMERKRQLENQYFGGDRRKEGGSPGFHRVHPSEDGKNGRFE